MEPQDKSDAKIVCKSLEKVQGRVGETAVVCADDGPGL